MSQIKIKRGTRAQLDAAASGAELIQGEPYLITDEDRIAVGLSTTTYEEFVKPADPISDLAETASAKILTSSERNKLDDIEAGATTDLFAATNNNASAITIGQPVYVDGSGTVDLARANAAATDRAIGLVADASIAAAAAGNIQQGGVITSANWTGVIGSTNLAAGADYFLDAATAGKLTATAPTTAGQFVVQVGHAISTTKMLIGIERPVGL